MKISNRIRNELDCLPKGDMLNLIMLTDLTPAEKVIWSVVNMLNEAEKRPAQIRDIYFGFYHEVYSPDPMIGNMARNEYIEVKINDLLTQNFLEPFEINGFEGFKAVIKVKVFCCLNGNGLIEKEKLKDIRRFGFTETTIKLLETRNNRIRSMNKNGFKIVEDSDFEYFME